MDRLIALIPLLLASSAFADDWPQWMGPQRDNVWRETGIVEEFDSPASHIEWRTPIAGGYAGPAVANGRVYVTDYVSSDNQDVKVSNFDRNQFSGIERVLCLDEASGKILWKHEYPVKYSISYPAGPRCTPNVHHGKVYTLGAEGDLICFEAETGKVVWSKNLPETYNAKTPLWGYAAHPLIDGNRLITLAGGPGSHAVALDIETGEEIWRTLTSEVQGYSPPTIINAGGARQLILAHPEGLASVNPETGEEYWEVPYEASNGSIIMSPIHQGKYLYIGGFNKKNLLVELASDKPMGKTVWRDIPRQALAPVNTQPAVQDKTIIGFDQDGMLYGVDLPSGERLWRTLEPINEERPVYSGTALIVKNGDRYILFNEDGELLLARLSRDGYEEIDSMKVLEPTNLAFGREVVWSAPAYADKSAFIRNDEEIIRVDLAK